MFLIIDKKSFTKSSKVGVRVLFLKEKKYPKQQITYD